MKFEYTKDELNILEQYRKERYESVNQLLLSNCEDDLSMLSEKASKSIKDIPYDRMGVIENINYIKILYRLCMKYYYNEKNKEEEFYRGTNMVEIDRLTREPFIDTFLSASKNMKDAEENYAKKWDKPALLRITLDEEVPFIDVDKVLGEDSSTNVIIISPFTKIKTIEEDKTIDVKDTSLYMAYHVVLEKQNLEDLTEVERKGLYNYILENSYSIKRKLEECINLDNENSSNYEKIRKLEELRSEYEAELDEKGTFQNFDYDDKSELSEQINNIDEELDALKEITQKVFNVKKDNISFVNMWKRDIAVYLIAECKEIEKEFMNENPEFYTKEELDEIEEKNEIQRQEENTIDKNVERVSLDENLEMVSSIPIVEAMDEKAESESAKEDRDNSDEEPVSDKEDSEENVEENAEENELDESPAVEEVQESDEDDDPSEIHKRVKAESKENVDLLQKLLHNIENLISKQQSYARIAGNMDTNYSALNNAFDMRKTAEALDGQVKKIYEKVKDICSKGDNEKIDLELELISKTNIEIGTLLNYLNNPRILSKNSKATRFDELAIIEENALKKGIAEKIQYIRGEAELKKLDDDQEIIMERSGIQKFLGIFTGQNKLDEEMIRQIGIRKETIRKKLSSKLRLTDNYSIHELMAEIVMFVNENEDDYLVTKEVFELKSIAAELRKNYVILESRVQEIIQNRNGQNLPAGKKMSKIDVIEADTYKFLKKYKYDVLPSDEPEPVYQDTMANEIARIVDYVNTSKII